MQRKQVPGHRPTRGQRVKDGHAVMDSRKNIQSLLLCHERRVGCEWVGRGVHLQHRKLRQGMNGGLQLWV